jgi:membrane protein required for colicin V production
MQGETMLDIILVLVIIVSAVISSFQGIVKILFSTAAFVLGVLAAVVFNSAVAVHFAAFPALGAKIFAFVIIFIIVFLIIKILQSIVARMFEGEILKGLDRALGFLFGIVQGVFFAGAILFALKTQKFIDVSHLLASSYFFHLFELLIAPSIVPNAAFLLRTETSGV